MTALPESRILAGRHARLRDDMGALGLDALVVTQGSNVRYLANHTGTAGALVVTPAAVTMVVDFRYQESLRALQASPAACPELTVWPVPASYDEALLACLAQLGARRVGFEAQHLTVARHTWWRAAAAAGGLALEFVPTERVIEQLRLVKDAFEVAALRRGAAALGDVAQAAFAAVRAGRAEREVAGAIEAALRDAGFERPAFETIVASGPNGALPHYRAGSRLLAPGDLVVLDFGGVMDGYCCDLTRAVTIGATQPDSRRLFDAVHAAQAAALAAVRPGIDTAAVDAAARDVLQACGLGPAFGHGTGHGLGLEVHEEPRISQRRADAPAVTLTPGMVFTIEPGAYLPGFGGVRIEDDVLVTAAGSELLTTVPREWRVC